MPLFELSVVNVQSQKIFREVTRISN